jgi:hypothetical protein
MLVKGKKRRTGNLGTCRENLYAPSRPRKKKKKQGK